MESVELPVATVGESEGLEIVSMAIVREGVDVGFVMIGERGVVPILAIPVKGAGKAASRTVVEDKTVVSERLGVVEGSGVGTTLSVELSVCASPALADGAAELVPSSESVPSVPVGWPAAVGCPPACTSLFDKLVPVADTPTDRGDAVVLAVGTLSESSDVRGEIVSDAVVLVVDALTGSPVVTGDVVDVPVIIPVSEMTLGVPNVSEAVITLPFNPSDPLGPCSATPPAGVAFCSPVTSGVTVAASSELGASPGGLGVAGFPVGGSTSCRFTLAVFSQSLRFQVPRSIHVSTSLWNAFTVADDSPRPSHVQKEGESTQRPGVTRQEEE